MVEAVADVLAVVAWMARVSPTAKGKVAMQDEVMYCQKVCTSYPDWSTVPDV